MTVIAILFADTFPIALTDTLISNQSDPDTFIYTPLTDNERRPGPDNFRPVGLAKKAIRVGTGLHVLYAGETPAAWEIIGNVWSRTQGITPYDETIHKQVLAWANSKAIKASVIVVQVVDGEGLGLFGSDRVTGRDLDGFGTVMSAGSGARGLIRIMNDGYKFPLPDAGLDDPAFMGTAMANAMLVAVRASEDYMNLESTMAAASTGGFFEVIFPPTLFDDFASHAMRQIARSAIVIALCEMDESRVRVGRLLASTSTAAETVVVSNTAILSVPKTDPWHIAPGSFRGTGIAEAREDSTSTPLPAMAGIEVRTIAVVVAARCPDCGVKRIGRDVTPGFGSVLGALSIDDEGMTLIGVTHYIHKLASRVGEARCEACGRTSGSSQR